MAATCAGCLAPIPSGEKFVLSGTEVFHRACASTIARSIGVRQKLEIQRLRQELADREQDLRDRDRELRSLEQASAESDKMIQRARKQVAELDKQVREVENSTRRDARRITELDTDNRALQSERRVLRENLEAARAEIARLQAQAISRATDDLPVPAVKDTRDDTEIRFSLLEIDPV